MARPMIVSTSEGRSGRKLRADGGRSDRDDDEHGSGAQQWHPRPPSCTLGVAAGCSSSTFCPTQSVTREQMASFLARALGLGD